MICPNHTVDIEVIKESENVVEPLYSRYHLIFIQQLPHQTLGQSNDKYVVVNSTFFFKWSLAERRLKISKI